MAEQTLNLERDLREAREMISGLVEYVRGDQLYGSAGGGLFGSGSQPALTIGALLLRLRRLRAMQGHLTEAQRRMLSEIEAQHESTRREWKQHYDEKLLREANSRLDAMRAYFEECSQNPRLCANAYLPEALRRTIVQEIAAQLENEGIASDELNTKMQRTDGRLRQFVRPDGFLWASELADVYPKQTFWWLYNRPPYPEGT